MPAGLEFRPRPTPKAQCCRKTKNRRVARPKGKMDKTLKPCLPVPAEGPGIPTTGPAPKAQCCRKTKKSGPGTTHPKGKMDKTLKPCCSNAYRKALEFRARPRPKAQCCRKTKNLARSQSAQRVKRIKSETLLPRGAEATLGATASPLAPAFPTADLP